MQIDTKEQAVILIVDDTPANIDVLFNYLSERQFNVLVASDGESALEQIQYANPDLVLLDVLMPGIDGFETCRRLKANAATRDIPVIFMTALSDTTDKVTGFAVGAVDYVTKPIQHEEVMARVNAHLTIRRLQAHLRENEERLSSILESAMDAIITTDERLDIILFNSSAEKTFRCAGAAAMGQPFENFIALPSRDLFARFLADFDRRRSAERYLWAPAGLVAQRADGECFPIEATISQAEFQGKKINTIILRDIDQRERAEAALQKLRSEKQYLQEEIRSEYNFDEIVGDSEAIRHVFKSISRVAATETTVLITGETGTGKELVARALHNMSGRRDGPFIKVNCAALPVNLIESELFGHEKGAFTGATSRKKGRFELADHGTIFLDEIGELPVETQVKLLRVLQEQEFEYVGGTRTLKVDTRVVAATNRNLEDEVRKGTFRSDLFFRLNIFPIHLPPLRERKQDIQLLADYFAQKFAAKMGKRISGLSTRGLELLNGYHWAGNVRELANIVERACILCDGRLLQPEHLGISNTPLLQNGDVWEMDEVERRHIIKALEKTRGRVGGPKGAAELLGVNRTTLIARMKKLGIDHSA